MGIQITIKAARINANLTQIQAASRLGIDRTTLQNYEKGATVPSWDMVHKMSRVYNLPFEVLVVRRESA